jgi:glycosyltransferase involved in cell wall biosynthesis
MLQQYDNFEVIVADDGSTDNTRDVVEDAARIDPRIRYTTLGESVGMRDNFEFALSQVKPGYVLALGGDDGLLPYGIQGMSEALHETGQELLAWPHQIYFYEGARSPTAQLVCNLRGIRSSNKYRIIKSCDFLANQAKRFHYAGDIESPMIYVKGVVSTNLIERVRMRSPNGRFYTPSTPDGYSGIVLAGEVETYAFSNNSFSIFGITLASAGISYIKSNKKEREVSEEFFSKVATIPMHKELASQPYSPLISLMTADFLLTARDLPGWPGSFPPINYCKLLRSALLELEDGQFAVENIARELGILDEIAKQQDLGAFFRKEVGNRYKNLRKPLEGYALSFDKIYFDATQLGIKNIYDAAFFTYYLQKSAPEFSFATAWRFLKNTLSYKMLSYKRGAPFPIPREWERSDSN